jgi:hypothetical protein
MNDPDINRKVKHRIQVASHIAMQPGSGTASLVVPTEKCLDMNDNLNATIHWQAICCRGRLGLSIPGPGLHLRTRCRPSSANDQCLLQARVEFLRLSRLRGRQLCWHLWEPRKARVYASAQVWGSPFTHWQKRVAYDVRIVKSNAVSHSA